MKCQLKPTQQTDRAVRVEFDRVIPQLFPRSKVLPRQPVSGDKEKAIFTSTPSARARHALRVARRNAGRFPFERANSCKVYAELFERIVAIEGLVEVVDLNRYTLGIEVGGLFNLSEVATQFVTVIQQAFYPEEEIDFGNGFEIQDSKAKGLQSAEAITGIEEGFPRRQGGRR
jgi:hypothetical protein